MQRRLDLEEESKVTASMTWEIELFFTALDVVRLRQHRCSLGVLKTS
jgi:hypothetical protein